MQPNHQVPSVAIACGGTGGHLFPGVAVGEALVRRGGAVTLIVSPKAVDQAAVEWVAGMEAVTIPAIGLTRGRWLAFAWSVMRSYRMLMREFRRRRPAAVLAMGGYTSVAPILAARRCGARTFLHESNTVPGRANRWLAGRVDEVFVGFSEAMRRLKHRQTTITGTPVREPFRAGNTVQCRRALGLEPDRPLVLIMGGSQGASPINRMVLDSLPGLLLSDPPLQFIHLTGSLDYDRVRAAYMAQPVPAIVLPFFGPMELAMGAASVAISRAGASSLAEIAAVQLPSILVPFPQAADDHQRHNARAFAETGAAVVLDQETTAPATLIDAVAKLAGHEPLRLRMQSALHQWHRPEAAEEIARRVLASLGVFGGASATPPPATGSGSGKGDVAKRREEAADAA